MRAARSPSPAAGLSGILARADSEESARRSSRSSASSDEIASGGTSPRSPGASASAAPLAVEASNKVAELLSRRDEQAAVECNKRGLEANSAGDTATALDLFLKAYELKPAQPNYALSAANMHLKRSDSKKAIELYSELLREPGKLLPKQQSMAQTKMAQVWG